MPRSIYLLSSLFDLLHLPSYRYPLGEASFAPVCNKVFE